MGYQLFADFYNAGCWRRKTDTRRQTCAEQFVRQNPRALRIILEFHNVVGLFVRAGFGL
jgi:hypothetical protein